ncbi:hypothetical protein TNIN_154641 [Trichonephila inaurata madagascariensis]|uniref:Uncharacterized protein n=1 Tax=Trichonephila inaurata madagascariensis TaxID=2747483 RepID=A0A8X6YHC9_9ARAC|nr:hypothetical protein TNIN_154641 [Trichonephila inaurata madagascariensis]
MVDSFVCTGKVDGFIDAIVDLSVNVILVRDGGVSEDRSGKYGLKFPPIREGKRAERGRHCHGVKTFCQRNIQRCVCTVSVKPSCTGWSMDGNPRLDAKFVDGSPGNVLAGLGVPIMMSGV